MTHSPLRSIPRRSGFTLIEMLITLVVIAIVAGLAVPRMDAWLGVSRLNSAMDAFRGDLAYARTLALRSGRPVIVEVDAQRYQIRTVRQNGDTVIAKRVDFASEDPILRFSTHPNAVPVRLDFNSRGLLENAPVTTVTGERNGRTTRVRILPTGRVHRE